MRLAIMKYGVGSWKAISSAKVLPGKTTTQIVGQVQRMMGQQSLRGISMVIGVHWSLEFLKIKLDPLLVGKDNAKKHNVSRKSGIIVNEGRMGCCLVSYGCSRQFEQRGVPGSSSSEQGEIRFARVYRTSHCHPQADDSGDLNCIC